LEDTETDEASGDADGRGEVADFEDFLTRK